MKRSELREHLFLMLFRKEFHQPEELKEQAMLYLEESEVEYKRGEISDKELKAPTEQEKQFLEQRFESVLEKLDEIDTTIDNASVGWKLNRMGKVELTILRLATFEIVYDEEIPTKVAINEAVELAKKFGEDNSSSFVNGVLAKLAD